MMYYLKEAWIECAGGLENVVSRLSYTCTVPLLSR